MSSHPTSKPGHAPGSPPQVAGAEAWPVPRRVTGLVLGACWLAILSEGYDVGVLGAVLPALADDAAWNLTPLELGGLGSYALVGMLIGALFIGTLSDRRGRKVMLLVCMAIYTITQLGAALAPTPEVFGLMRFIGGLGMGGVIPVAAALTIEYSPPRRRSLNYAIMYSGYSLGIVAAALVALALVAEHGWRLVVGLGAAPVVLIPLIAWLLPESLESLENRGQPERARALAARLGVAPYRPAAQAVAAASGAPGERRGGAWRHILAQLFGPAHLRSTLCFWISLFCGLLLVYGLNTWLPSIMRDAGYDLGSALTFLLVFSLASAAGGLVIGGIADRFGQRPVLVVFYLLGGAGSLLLMFENSMWVNLSLVAFAGIGSISTSLVLTGYIADYYPASVRATAAGWALSFARIGAILGPVLGGWIAALNVSVQWNFIAFASVAAVAGLAVWLIPARKAALVG